MININNIKKRKEEEEEERRKKVFRFLFPVTSKNIKIGTKIAIK